MPINKNNKNRAREINRYSTTALTPKIKFFFLSSSGFGDGESDGVGYGEPFGPGVFIYYTFFKKITRSKKMKRFKMALIIQ